MKLKHFSFLMSLTLLLPLTSFAKNFDGQETEVDHSRIKPKAYTLKPYAITYVSMSHDDDLS